MADQEGSGRQKGVIIAKSIVYGNIARYFGKKREEDGHTHKWTVFVRPFHQTDDLSTFIKKVEIKLHDSYPNPVRTLQKPPFEVTETGWGEFDLTIKLFFVDAQEKPVVLSHLLKLFQNDTEIMMGRKNLVREIYDELIFVEPSAQLQRHLQSAPARQLAPSLTTDFEARFHEVRHQILDMNTKGAAEIAALREQLKVKKRAIDRARDIMDELEADTLRVG